jgi:hypothetical protein
MISITSTYLKYPISLCFVSSSHLVLCYRYCGHISTSTAEDGTPTANLVLWYRYCGHISTSTAEDGTPTANPSPSL